MSQNTKRYWKGIEEYQNTEEFVFNAENEFTIPEEEQNGASEGLNTRRRDFLKLMGFSVAAASLAACETPVKKAIPYITKPQEVFPTVANYYASTYFNGNDYASVLVKTREGRPIKVEGNRLSKISQGGTSARAQASVLDLYDTFRYQGFTSKTDAPNSKEDKAGIDKKIKQALSSAGSVRIVSPTIISPSTLKAIDAFKSAYSLVDHVQYDAYSMSGLLDANEKNFGLRALPQYHFDKAKVVVSLGADFLGTWGSPTEYSKAWAKTRRPSEDDPKMSKLFAFESNLSITGANADVRKAVRPTELGLYAAELLKGIGGPALKAKAKPSTELELAIKKLKENAGSSVVVSGSNDPNVQLVVNAINNQLNNYGKTITWDKPNYLYQGSDADMDQFVHDVMAGSVDAVIFYGCNPVYDHPRGKEIAQGLQKVKTKVTLADRPDETAVLCDFACPDYHYLEAWNDAMPKEGMYSLTQPTIKSLFNGRQAQDSLLVWAGSAKTYYDVMQDFWKEELYPKQTIYSNFRQFWNYSLHDGIFDLGRQIRSKKEIKDAVAPKPNSEMPEGEPIDTVAAPLVDTDMEADTMGMEADTVAPMPVDVPKPVVGPGKYSAVNLSDAGLAIAQTYASDKGGMDVVLYQKGGIGTGTQTGNPWLLELPDPISKATWDNYLAMSMSDAESMELKQGDVVKVTLDDNEVAVPVLIQPGQAKGSAALALGYGRTVVGKAGKKVGAKVIPFSESKDVYPLYFANGIAVEKTGETRKIAQTQTHETVMARPVVQETTLRAYKEDPAAGRYFPKIHTENGEEDPNNVSMWDEHPYPNHHWGLTIDLNTCTGCSACVVACHAENNVPVVGREEVLNRREMHWIRIDRYYSSDADEGEYFEGDMKALEKASENPEVTFMPMMCQHCNHAPCETVCPVLATTHSTEGLNQMTYNRCIGTRYCANNCPYKVRRFNWFQYPQNDKFDYHMNNDLGRMVLNPDVTVRARGVMEKCSMCQQRIQDGKLKAKRAKRKLKDGDVVTACAEACPSDAIVFGDMRDPESRISKMLEKQTGKRAYHVLEELNVQPNVTYLTKIRNKDKEEKDNKEA